MASTIYEPIHKISIRLLRYDSEHSTKDELHFDFHKVVHLTKGGHPAYTAVSYTWGQSAATVRIYVNGLPFMVRPNLAACLEALTQADSPAWKWIWADAICINQDDIRERNEQVRNMAAIYSQASAVSVWLPDNSTDGDSCSDANPAERAKSFLNVQPQSEWHMGNSPYWNRLWIIQEFLLAGKIHIYSSDGRLLHCDRVLPVTRMSLKAARIRGEIDDEPTGIETLPKAVEDSHRMMSLIKTAPAAQQRSMFVDAVHVGERFAVSPFAALIARRYDAGVDLSSLTNMLKAYADSKCRDPRDKVFGIMSLLADEERTALSRVLPDYGMSEAQVVAVALAHILVFDGFIVRGRRLRETAAGRTRRLFLLWYVEEFCESYKDQKLEHWKVRKKLPWALRLNLLGRLSLGMEDLVAWLAEC
ncbi:hypothetical protein OHC33_005081 [Knufia fluminis]|uniref:Heterokaryon incompatibility domain-containing protein n=1 Tax=Knufia fluminis TaxID=191047 RepID=A0AAN8IN32_9EURO|nr:hypothetical protein OHC33_005081 [Knufia fluminis]